MKWTSLLLFSFLGLAASGQVPSGGAYPAGTANIFIAADDHWANFHNPAMLSFADTFSAGLYATNLYSVKELGAGAFASAIPLQDLAVVGVGAYFLNNGGLYKNYAASFTLARDFNRVSAGIRFGVSHYQYVSYNSEWLLYSEAGLVYKLNDDLKLGASVFNPTNGNVQEEEDVALPTIIEMGISWQANNEVLAAAGISHEFNEATRAKAALSYQPTEKFKVFGGIMTNPLSSSFGLGLQFLPIEVNFAFALHQSLGVTPHLSVDYFRQ